MMGHRVITATNGREGLEVFRNNRDVNCILMDIQCVVLVLAMYSNLKYDTHRMPLLDGYECTAAIRKVEQEYPLKTNQTTAFHDINQQVPIFAVSASLVESRRDAMRAIGLNGWIMKPIDVKSLKTILSGVTDLEQRTKAFYGTGRNWESGGWLPPR